MSDDPFKALAARRAALRQQMDALDREEAELRQLHELAAKHNLTLTSRQVPRIETIRDLAERYRADPASAFHKLKFATRNGYEHNITRLLEFCGDRRIADLTAREIQTLYDVITNAGERKSIGHALMTMLRILAGYGGNALEHPECKMLAFTLHGMDFTPPKPREAQLTLEHVTAIIRKAQEKTKRGLVRLSIGKAQAIQFECGLRQKVVIGEWVPMDDPAEPSTIFSRDNKMKWVRGLRWSDVNGTTLTYDGRTYDLTKCPLVTTELGRVPERDRHGAIIKNERTGLPYESWLFRRVWREIADEAGVPKEVNNTDIMTEAKARRIRATEGNASAAR